MHPEILSQQQDDLLKYLMAFKRKYYLVGGTAIALHLGHRRSIDFDLYTSKATEKNRLRKNLMLIPYKQIPLFEDVDQLHIMVNGVKLTFFYYPFQIDCPVKVFSGFKMPDLLTLAAMKTFALGRRAKWKDYVDLYFIIKDHFSIVEISKRAKKYLGINMLRNYSGSNWHITKISTIPKLLNTWSKSHLSMRSGNSLSGKR